MKKGCGKRGTRPRGPVLRAANAAAERLLSSRAILGAGRLLSRFWAAADHQSVQRYQANCRLEHSAPDGFFDAHGCIWNQHATPMADMHLHSASLEAAGCGVLAVHNVLAFLGRANTLAGTARLCEQAGVTVAAARFGCDPYRLPALLAKLGLGWRLSAGQSPAALAAACQGADAVIFTYWNDRFCLRAMMHTVALLPCGPGGGWRALNSPFSEVFAAPQELWSTHPELRCVAAVGVFTNPASV